MLEMFPFIRDDVLPSWWANSLQKRLSVGACGLTISKLSATVIQVVAAAGDAAAVIDIAGKWRWNEATVNRAHPGGGAATFDIFVTAKANSIVNVPAPGTDTTDYSFALAIVAHNATPAVVAGVVDIFRKIGECDWDGAQITSIKQTVGSVPRPSNGAGDSVEALRALGTGAGQAMPGVTRLNGIPVATGTVDLNGQRVTNLGAPAAASDAVRNDDARLSNARTPTAHAATHRPGGSDPLTLTNSVIAAQPVLDVGQVGQMRAGHTLTVADFTSMGVSLNALFNLSDLTNPGGPQNLTNKGAVPFGVGILGAASTCAVFSWSSAQALYITDQGAADGYRLASGGTAGCWVKTGRRGVVQAAMSKWDATGLQQCWLLYIDPNGLPTIVIDTTGGGAQVTAAGTTDVANGRWNHLAWTQDGSTLKLYVNGNLEASVVALGFPGGGPNAGTHVPFNIGGQTADASTVTSNPFGGSIDEAFVSPDVLTEDQIRLVYALKLAHSYPVTPGVATVGVKRRRRGAALSGVTGVNFPTAPKRLYNFAPAAATVNEGSDGGSFNLLSVGTIFPVPGADGLVGSAAHFDGASSYYASDTGLPTGTATRSFGCWIRTVSLNSTGVMAWGTHSTADARLIINGGSVQAYNGAAHIDGLFIADGAWHHVVVVEDNAAADGVKRKLYVDGRLVASGTTLNSITLAGLNAARLGSNADASSPFAGDLDGAFICNYALTAEQVNALFAVAGQTIGSSPKNEGDHVEAMDATNVFAIFDSLEPQHLVDLKVAA